MKLLIASDHAGFELKNSLVNSSLFSDLKIQIQDLGPVDTSSVDYPDFADRVASQVNLAAQDLSQDSLQMGTLGLLICGSGQGMAIRANKYSNVRAALCLDENMASLARQHNNANILCLGARLSSFDIAKKIIQTFYKTAFEGGRHQQRVTKISSSLK